ncbi:MAG: hypothetical protein IPM55_22105 [Acidobacteria bacterium]|nr:hypothetical protein [Acidobacteriota bacterium]
MANEQTTQFKPITKGPMPQVITIYAPDGSPHKCAPVDAREILASGLGYTAEPPVAGAVVEVVVDETSEREHVELTPDIDAATTTKAAIAGKAKPVAKSAKVSGKSGSGKKVTK